MADTKLVWLITGANSGLGLNLSLHALAQGHTVIATARKLSKFPQSLKEHPNADLIEIEISAPASAITKVANDAFAKHGRVDVLVNNAGFGQMGALEEVTEEEVRYQFDINFFGLLNFAKAVLPHMRKQKSGIIMQVSSGGGIFAGEGGAVYVASKFAVEGVSEALANEVKALGIRVHIVEPGFFRTEFLTQVAAGKQAGQKVDGYLDIGSMLKNYSGNQPGDPQKGAQRIFEVVTGTGMGAGLEGTLRVPLGSDCVGMFEAKIASLKGDLEKMRSLALSTDLAV